MTMETAFLPTLLKFSHLAFLFLHCTIPYVGMIIYFLVFGGLLFPLDNFHKIRDHVHPRLSCSLVQLSFKSRMRGIVVTAEQAFL